jgi:hypothetical protein
MDPRSARRAWHVLEPVNAVTYFAPESREAAVGAGLKGFWMGYFAFRAAPMGPVAAGVVEATFYNFHPDRVRRAIPDAWGFAQPARLLEVRAAAAAAALRRLLPDGAVERLAGEVLPPLRRAMEVADTAGRPLFAANCDVEPPEDPVAALWQAATSLREHRGDGHVALLGGAGLDGCEVHLLLAATSGISGELLRQSRGWSEDDWGEAQARLTARGLLDADGDATEVGRRLHREIEARTDELAVAPYRAIADEAFGRLLTTLGGAAERIAAADELPFPNPMGLPRAT